MNAGDRKKFVSSSSAFVVAVNRRRVGAVIDCGRFGSLRKLLVVTALVFICICGCSKSETSRCCNRLWEVWKFEEASRSHCTCIQVHSSFEGQEKQRGERFTRAHHQRYQTSGSTVDSQIKFTVNCLESLSSRHGKRIWSFS